MTQTMIDQDGGIDEWEVERLIERLTDGTGGGEVVRLTGVTPTAVKRRFSEVRRRLRKQESLALVLDPNDTGEGSSTLRELIAEYARAVQQSRRLDEASDELVDFLASTRDRSTSPYSDSLSARAYKNTICRLWKALSDEMPAVLFGFHLDDCSSTESDVLEHLVSEFFSDPVADYVPELAEPGRLQSTLVVVEGMESFEIGLSDAEVAEFDLSTPVRESLREVLASDDVVDQFLASTGGDPRQLDALLSSLPSDCEDFWEYRFDRLAPAAQTVVELLAVARGPLTIDCLKGAVELVEPNLEYSATVRRLTDEGFLERQIESGAVRLQLADADFRRALVADLDETRLQGLHLALAESAIGAELEVVDDRFLAYHFLEAEEVERGFDFGLRAARRLHGEHALNEARDLFDILLDHAPDGDDAREIRHYLVDIDDALGNFKPALEQIRALIETSDSSRERARLECKGAELYVRTGRYERAEEIFEELTAEEEACKDETIRAAALFGHAESMYLQGRHAEAEPLVGRAIELLETPASAASTSDVEVERTLVKARNLQGKLTLYQGDLESAQPLFEANYTLATERGLDREITRAELNLAVVELQKGNYAAALETLEELRSRTPGPEGAQRAALLINLGMAAQQEGDYTAGLEHYRSAIREARRADYQEAVSMAAYNLATALLDLGNYERMLGILDRLEDEQSAGRHLFMGESPGTLRAKALIERGDPAEGLEVLESLEAVEDDRVSEGARGNAVLSSVHAHLDLGQIDHARRQLEDFELPDQPTPSHGLEGLETAAWAALHLAEGDFKRAADSGKTAVGELQDRAYFSDRIRAMTIRARALRKMGRTGEATSVVERGLTGIQQRAESIPEELREDFFETPVFQELVDLGRELGGETPTTLDHFEKPDRPSLGDGRADGGRRKAPDRDSEGFRRWRRRYAEIVGEDERLLKIFRRIDQVATSDSPVLIQGESGTGKELIAEAVHREGTDAGEPFVKVNCGAFVDNLLLSEMFGHVKGAFTGAVDEKVGRFEQADGGTIFLDEVGEMSQKAQVALLRVLQEGEFERVGGTETKTVDARVICATNRDLETMVERGEFRLDLYYRLKGVLLELPPLRERRQDIPRLVRHFADGHVGEDEAISFQRDVMEFLASYSWPGNIRELKNFVRSILLFVEGEEVTMEHLRGFRDFFTEGEVDLEAPDIDYDVPVDDYAIDEPEPEALVENPAEALVEEIVDDRLDLAELKKRIEHQSIRRALEETDGNITRAAEILQMTRPRLSQIVNADDRLVELKEKLVG